MKKEKNVNIRTPRRNNRASHSAIEVRNKFRICFMAKIINKLIFKLNQYIIILRFK